jgi:hypothetical protein
MGRTEIMTASWDEIKNAIAQNAHRDRRPLGSGAASKSLVAIPQDNIPVPWLPGWTEDTTFTISDVVSLGLWIRDPLYRTATASVRRMMEREEATYLLNESEAAWKSHNGRVRGWVRKHLEEDLRNRSAAGDPAPDAWNQIKVHRRAAQLVDYVCIMRGIRVALWFPGDEPTVQMIPASGLPADVPVVQINCVSGRILLNDAGFLMKGGDWPNTLASAASFKWATSACAPSIGAQTVAQIQERLAEVLPGVACTGSRQTIWVTLLKEMLFRELRSAANLTLQPLP